MAVRSANGTLLIFDCGLSCRQLVSRANVCGIDVGTAKAVLFTHDHSDHYYGADIFRKSFPSIPFFANGDTADAIAAKMKVDDNWEIFETSVPFELEDFRITPFATSHDAADPVGYLVQDGISTLFIGTDTGIATNGFINALSQANCAVIESNHDPILLEQCNRPIETKRRIAGRSGHLSNEDAADAMRLANPPNLKFALLAHISQECNMATKALNCMTSALQQMNRPDVMVAALSQNAPDELRVF